MENPGHARNLFSVAWESKSRPRTQVLVPVDRLPAELLDLGAFQHIEHHFGAGFTARPQLAVEVSVATHRLAAHADDDVAGREPGFLGRALRRHPRGPPPSLRLLG